MEGGEPEEHRPSGRSPPAESPAPCSEGEPEGRGGEPRERAAEPGDPELKEEEEAGTDPEDTNSRNEKEPSQEPRQEDKQPRAPDDEDQTDSPGGHGEVTTTGPHLEPKGADDKTERANPRVLKKANSFGKTVRFLDTAVAETVEESLFPGHEVEQWTSSSFEDMLMAEDWEDITDDRLLRKKVLEPGPLRGGARPAWGQQVTVKMHGVLEDRTVVEKDCKLVFVIGEGDVNQALEECAMSMQWEEIALLLADSQYTYGHLGREPDIPPWSALLYQLQLLDFRDKPDPRTLPVSDHIRVGNRKRERGNFLFQREEYGAAARAYSAALDVLTTPRRRQDGDNGGGVLELEEEVREYRVKCLNNLAAAQLRLEQHGEALHTSRDVLALDPNNVKALFRTGKILSDRGAYGEAMETLKKALKLEPSTKAIHVELSKLVRRQSGGKDTQKWKAKSVRILGENIAPFLTPSKKKPPGNSWKFLLGALVVALGSLVTSVVLTARN